MISVIRIGDTVNTPAHKIVGLSTDDMTTIPPVPNGTTFFQMDTGLTCMWDEENKKWHKVGQSTVTGEFVPAGSGGSENSNLVGSAVVDTALAG